MTAKSRFDWKMWNIVKQKQSLLGKKILTFGYIGIQKNKFYRNKTPVFKKDVGIEEVLVSDKIAFGKRIILYWLLV